MILQMEQYRQRQTAEHAPRQPSDAASYWLIAHRRNNRIALLTLRAEDEQQTLPVFSSEEEAEIFLRFGGVADGWRARGCGEVELVSVLLSGPCAGVEKVALDPSPEMVVGGTVGLVSLLRGAFMNLVVAMGSEPLELGDEGVPGASVAIQDPERRTGDGETKGIDLLAAPRRRGQVCP